MTSKQARAIAAQFWCYPTTSKTEMDSVLAEVIAEKIDKYLDALLWCGGSQDFGPGGEAEEGWNRIVKPLLTEAQSYVDKDYVTDDPDWGDPGAGT